MAPRSRNIAMEFACCPAICDAIKARVDKRIFGYTMMFDDAYYKALKLSLRCTWREFLFAG